MNRPIKFCLWKGHTVKNILIAVIALSFTANIASADNTSKVQIKPAYKVEMSVPDHGEPSGPESSPAPTYSDTGSGTAPSPDNDGNAQASGPSDTGVCPPFPTQEEWAALEKVWEPSAQVYMYVWMTQEYRKCDPNFTPDFLPSVMSGTAKDFWRK